MPSSLSDDDLDKLVYGPTGKKEQPTSKESAEDMSGIEQIGRGAAQAALNIPEVPLYYAEKAGRLVDPSFNIVPQSVRNWGKNFRDVAESSPLGVAGEIGGSLLSGSAEIGALSKLPAVARAVSRFPRLGSTALGSIAGLWSRPAENPTEAAIQAGTGGLAGRYISGQAAVSANRLAAQQTAAKAAADAERAALVAQSTSAAGAASRASTELEMARSALARETDPAIRKILEQRVALISQRSGQAGATAKAAAEDASRRPFGKYEHMHTQVPPGVASFLYHMPTSLKHIVARWLISGGQTLPQGMIPSAASNAVGQATPQQAPLRFTVPGNPQ